MAAYVDFPSDGIVSTPGDVSFNVTDVEIIVAARFDDVSNFAAVLTGVTDQPDAGFLPGVWAYDDGVGDDYIYFDWVEADLTGQALQSDDGIIATGAWRWYRVTLDVDDGAGNHVVRFYYSDQDVDTAVGSLSWTLHTTRTVAGVSSMATLGPLAQEVWMGRYDTDSTFDLDGKISYLEIRDGAGGTLVANPDFRVAGDTATQWTDDTGKVWTVESPAVWVDPPAVTGTAALSQAAQVGALAGTVVPPANTSTFAATQAGQVMAGAGTVTNPVIPPVPGSGGSRMGGTGAIRKPPRG